MTNGSTRVEVAKHNWIVFNWSRVSYSAPDNTSTIQWEMALHADSYGSLSAGGSSPWSISVDGNTYSGSKNLSVSASSSTVLASGTTVVSHNADGSKTLEYSFSQTFNISFSSVGYVGTVTGSGADAIDPISRASSPTLSSDTVNMGSAVTIYCNRASSAFTHTLKFWFGTQEVLIAENVEDSVSWTPPLSLAEVIPSATIGQGTVICETYLNGQKVGSQSVLLYLTVPSSVIPSLRSYFSDISGAYSKVGVFVSGITKFSFNISAEGAYGSTITAEEVYINGVLYSGGVVNATGDMSIIVRVTDSRGRTKSKSVVTSIAAYSPPIINITASRCDSDGTANETGAYAKVRCYGRFTDIDGNNVGQVTASWRSARVTATGAFDFTDIVSADVDSTKELTATASDAFATTRSAMTLSTGYATVDLLGNGKGVTFGAAATKEGFHCYMPTTFYGPVYGVGGNSPLSIDKDGYIYMDVAADDLGLTKAYLNPPYQSGVLYRLIGRGCRSYGLYTRTQVFVGGPETTITIPLSGLSVSPSVMGGVDKLDVIIEAYTYNTAYEKLPTVVVASEQNTRIEIGPPRLDYNGNVVLQCPGDVNEGLQFSIFLEFWM